MWSTVQSKPETKTSGKETEAEAQLYGFEQHKKIKEKVPERSKKHEGQRDENWNSGCHFPSVSPLTSVLTSLRFCFLMYKTGILIILYFCCEN